jgi:hypothetical protein
MFLGPREQMVVVDEALQNHSQPLAKLMGMLALIGLRSGADQLTLRPTATDYELSLLIGEQNYALRPPPSNMKQWLPDVMKAIAGMDLTVNDSAQKATIAIKEFEPDESWPVIVTVSPSSEGECITFEYLLKRECNFEFIKNLSANAAD